MAWPCWEPKCCPACAHCSPSQRAIFSPGSSLRCRIDDTAVLAKEAHKELKDLRYAADDRQRKYFKSLKKK